MRNVRVHGALKFCRIDFYIPAQKHAKRQVALYQCLFQFGRLATVWGEGVRPQLNALEAQPSQISHGLFVLSAPGNGRIADFYISFPYRGFQPTGACGSSRHSE
ncbi:hypothetical protein D3C87_1653900 [compost metagenome]